MTMKKVWAFAAVILGIGISAGVGLSGKGPGRADYDVIIRNGLVYDGSLNPPVRADIAIKDGRIARIGRRISETADRTIVARGLAVTPGFIDMHTHADRAMYFPEERNALSFLTQGVTSIVAGQCGTSAWPIFEEAADQIERWTREGIGPNAALLVGHGTVRRLVMGNDDREPTAEELDRMKSLVRTAMEQGASGISTGLIYMPGSQAETPEIIELVKVVAPYGGIYHSHVRNERENLLEAIGELIVITEAAKVKANISHFKVIGKSNWGLVRKACEMIEEARARGLEITADQYPFRFANTSPYSSLIPRDVWRGRADERLGNSDIFAVFDFLRDEELIALYSKVTPYTPLSEGHLGFLNGLPRKRLVDWVAQEVMSGGESGPGNARERMLFHRRLSDPEEGERIREGIRRYLEQVGPENMMIGISVEKDLEGKSIAEIAALKGRSLEDTAIELELMGAKAIPFNMGDDDIDDIMRKDYVTTGSDGIEPYYGIQLPHVRSFATFLYKIQEYAFRRKVVSLNHVIRSQTSLPAAIMDWDDRGWIKEGYAADLVILDLESIEVRSTISNPNQYSRGVKYLLINGELAIDEGKYTGALPGQILRPGK